jgi:hypothetical protein
MLFYGILSILFIPFIISGPHADFRHTACAPIHNSLFPQVQICVNQRLKKMINLRRIFTHTRPLKAQSACCGMR